MFATTLVDAAQEASGRSGLAREAQGFALALRDRSRDALRYLSPDEVHDPQAIAVLRDVMAGLGPDTEVMLTKVVVDSGGSRGQAVVSVLQPTSRGFARAEVLTIDWVRTEGGEWKASVLRP